MLLLGEQLFCARIPTFPAYFPRAFNCFSLCRRTHAVRVVGRLLPALLTRHGRPWSFDNQRYGRELMRRTTN